MKQVNVGLIGIGTIGKGVFDAIASNGRLIAERTGVSLVVKGVCDTDEESLNSVSAKICPMKTTSVDTLINNEEIDIIVELIGGVQPAKDIILSALRKKKHVVTANKALLSEHWKEIFATAAENRVFVDFEASVGGGIPIIRTLRESFVANKLNTIYGILNGTTNFILSLMAERGCPFNEALALAQEEGIAEKDPSLDISGKDSAHKLAILSLLGFGLDVSADDIHTEGITHIGPEDIRHASRWGYSIKLLAVAKYTTEGLQLRVHPALIPSAHLIADVRGSDNAIFVKGDLIGESLLFGKGAGRKPTSSSVISDLVKIGKYVAFYKDCEPEPFNLDYNTGIKRVSNMEKLPVCCYLRFSVIDRPGVLAGISSVLAKNDISIASVTQEERKEGEAVPVIILTHKTEEGRMRKAIAKIDTMDYVTDKTVVIRIED